MKDTVRKLENEVKEFIDSRLKAIRSIMICPIDELLPAEIAQAQSGKWINQTDIDSLTWQKVDRYFCLGADDNCWWIKKKITVPEVPSGWKLAITFSLGQNLGVWYGALLYINRVEFEGFTPPVGPSTLFGGHDIAILPDKFKPDDEIELLIKCYTGRDHGPLSPANPKFIEKFALIRLHQDTAKLYFKAITASKVMETLDENSGTYLTLGRILKSSLSLVDFTDPSRERTYKTISDALEYLTSELKKVSKDTLDTIKLSAVGHAHIDVGWTWPYVVTKEKTLQTVTTALSLIDRYPEYIFHQGQPQLYEFVREGAPRLFERIKEAVKKGRWDADGGMWVEPDCNIPSGESLVRQLLYGRRYFRDNFGVESKVLWLVDTFGFPHTLPQIARGCGIEFFVTTKISWNRYTTFPYTFFHWQGPDGTILPTYFISIPWYGLTIDTYNGVPDPVMIKRGWDRRFPKEETQELLGSIGWGDGGGGATFDMLEWMEAQKDGIAGKLQCRWEKTYPFLSRTYNSCKHQLPTWNDELFLEFHRGTLTTHAELKKLNRICEYTLQQTEMIATLLDFENTSQDEIRKLWEKMLINQFHDVMAGSSAHDVFEEARSIYLEVIDAAKKKLSASAKNHLGNSDDHIVIFNTLSTQRKGLVELILPENKVLADPNGNVLPYQRIDESKILVDISLPPIGYKKFKLIDEKTTSQDSSALTIADNILENEYLKVEIDTKTGFISSIYDKKNQREVLAGYGNEFQLFEDKPFDQQLSGWEIDRIYQERKLPIKFEVTDIKTFNGQLRAGFIIELKFSNSLIRQEIYLNHNEPVIYFRTWIDWQEHEVLLKSAFPVNITSSEACYEIQYGHIYRPTHTNRLHDIAKFEVPVHKWMDISEGGYGVSLLNDSKYGADIHDNVLRLTLLRAPVNPDPIADRGIQEFTYAIYPHAGDWKESRTVDFARKLNIKPIILQAKADLEPLEKSFTQIQPENLVIDVIKKCEDEDGIIVRLYESAHKRGRGKLTFDLPININSASICNMEEKNIKLLDINENSVEFDFRPSEIITIKLSPMDVLTLEPLIDEFLIA